MLARSLTNGGTLDVSAVAGAAGSLGASANAHAIGIQQVVSATGTVGAGTTARPANVSAALRTAVRSLSTPSAMPTAWPRQPRRLGLHRHLSVGACAPGRRRCRSSIAAPSRLTPPRRHCGCGRGLCLGPYLWPVAKRVGRDRLAGDDR